VATDCAYILSLAGGATSLSYSWTGTFTNAIGLGLDVEFFEVHRVSGTAAYDSCASGGNCIATVLGLNNLTTPVCPTTAGSSDYVAQWAAYTETFVGISGPYTSPSPDIDNSDIEAAFTGAINQTSPPQQIWNVSGGTTTTGAALSCVAFK
jgi:hypothetical protein